jgi:pimeloyl-ACP methyl ester carboxylesterase
MTSDALPRRGSLGVELAAGTFVVRRVAGGSTAEAAGVRVADRVVLVDDVPVTALPPLCIGDPVAIAVERAGEHTTLRTTVLAAPVERVAGADVELGHVTLPTGVRLRTFVTRPAGHEGKHAVVLLLPGLGNASRELSADPEDSERKLIEGLTALGFATLRVERSGVGDSEGPPASSLDLYAEVEGYRAALDSIRTDDTFGDVVLFGQSIGGMIAPLLGADLPLVVFGTSSRRWTDCIVRGTRLQKTLAGESKDAIDASVSAWATMHNLVCRDQLTPETVFALRPELRALEGSACRGESIFGRNVRFFQQLERVDLAALWRTVAEPVLVLAGEYDWICEPDEGRQIAGLASAADFVVLPKIGHDMRAHDDLAASFRVPRAGRWDGSILPALGAYLARVTT